MENADAQGLEEITTMQPECLIVPSTHRPSAGRARHKSRRSQRASGKKGIDVAKLRRVHKWNWQQSPVAYTTSMELLHYRYTDIHACIAVLPIHLHTYTHGPATGTYMHACLVVLLNYLLAYTHGPVAIFLRYSYTYM